MVKKEDAKRLNNNDLLDFAERYWVQFMVSGFTGLFDEHGKKSE
jgi:hypothetical protein